MLTFAQKYGKNVFSQFGEDGIIEEICKRLKIEKGSIAEFGAHDGKFCSNSRNLILLGWDATLIEGDIEKAKQCWTLYSTIPHDRTGQCIQVYCDMVTPENVQTMLWNDHEPFTIVSID